MHNVGFFKQSFEGLSKDEPILLACSGGVDSVVLAHLFHHFQFSFALAHVNYNLRGNDSVADALCVENLAKQLNVPLYIASTTQDSLKEIDNNTQLAARKYRYQFFDSIMKKHKFSYLATAHHGDDKIETFFLNLFRGTGIAGITGISAQEKIIRPLLQYSKQELTQFAAQNKLLWREDASNNTNYYERNKIRNQLIPLIEQEFPKGKAGITTTIENLNTDHNLLSQLITLVTNPHLNTLISGGITLPTLQIKQWNNALLIFKLLQFSGINYTTCVNLVNAVNKNSFSKVFHTTTHFISLMKTHLWVEPKTSFKPFSFTVEPNTRVELYPFGSVASAIQAPLVENKNLFCFLDKKQLTDGNYQIKNYDPTTRIKMRSGSKLISDVFSENEIPLHRRVFYPVLCLNNEPIWVLGLKKAPIIEHQSASIEIICFS
ncbi:MAG: tRNA lysidine(34) synthetase TilS [Luteibaculaceae bacterium]